MVQDIVFINFGWMINYQGVRKHDKIISNFGYVEINDYGHECYNFKPLKGIYRGYTPRSTKINIERLGGNKRKRQNATGITVVWVSTHPQTRQHVIVGWYENATVYPELFTYKQTQSGSIDYQIECQVGEAKLLPVAQRNFRVPTKPNGLGQSPIWYGNDEYNKKVKEYIKVAAYRNKRGANAPRQPDTEKRKRIEQAAIDSAIEFFSSPEGGSYNVISVERAAKGWDLEASNAERETVDLLIEVKGLSGDQISVQLTPNEFTMMREMRTQFVLYVLTEALTEKPKRSIFRNIEPASKQIRYIEDITGLELKIIKKTGAVASLD